MRVLSLSPFSQENVHREVRKSIYLLYNLCEDDEEQGSRSPSLWTQAAVVNRLSMSIMKIAAFRAQKRL